MFPTFRFFIKKVNKNSVMKSVYAATAENREGRIFRKMIDRTLTKKKKNLPKLLLQKKCNLLSAYENEGTKRMVVFNKAYMENITNMLYCGEYGRYLEELEVQLTRVKISKGLNFLNIYYILKKPDIPEEIINNVLKKTVLELQNKMGELKFYGKVPFIRFINDLRLENEIKLENIFNCMDNRKELNSSNAETVQTPYYTKNPDDLPVMREDVLGLDVAKIKARISAAVSQFKAININFPAKVDEFETPKNLIEFSKKDFIKFYKRKRIEELKRRKKERQGIPLCEIEDEYDNDLEYECADGLENELDTEYGNEFDYLDEFENENNDESDGDDDVNYQYADDFEDKMEK